MSSENYNNSGGFPPANEANGEPSAPEELSSKLRSPEDLGLEPSLEPLEVDVQEGADDPVRLYLHEIGKVRLLTAEGERGLAKKIEAAKRIKEIKQDYQQRYGKPASVTDIVLSMLKEIGQAATIIRLLQEQLDLPPTASFIESISEPKLRNNIYGVINQQ